MPLKSVMDNLEGVHEEVKKLFTEKDGKFEFTGVEGIKTQGDIDRQLKANSKERADHKATKEKYAALGDRDIAEVIIQLDKIPELEAAAAGGADEEKIKLLVDAKIKTITSPMERELKLLAETNVTLVGENQGFKSTNLTRSIHDNVIIAGRKMKVLPQAEEDILMHSERIFEIVEGKVVTKNEVGVTPGVDPETWLKEIQPRKGLWWGTSSGGGAPGGDGTNSTANPFSGKDWNLTAQGVAIKANRSQAENLAKSAGTTIGGKRPEVEVK